MSSVAFVRTITELQVSLLKKRKSIFCKNNKISSKICYFLFAHGLIHKYTVTKDNKYELWLKYLRNIILIKQFSLVSKPGWEKIYSLYKIKTLLWKHKNYLYLISASSRVQTQNRLSIFITAKEAVALNTGGEILLKIALI